MSTTEKTPSVPPRWFIRTAWVVHKGLFGITGGRFGLRKATGAKFGMMRVTTTGRKSGLERTVILGFLDDGPNLVTLAMNGWGAAEPAWWLNLQANPAAHVVIPGGSFGAKARAAGGSERDRLWDLWKKTDEGLDGYAALRPNETAVVVLEPLT